MAGLRALRDGAAAGFEVGFDGRAGGGDLAERSFWAGRDDLTGFEDFTDFTSFIDLGGGCAGGCASWQRTSFLTALPVPLKLKQVSLLRRAP